MKYITNAWIFIPVLFYFAVVLQFTVNIPIMDDYDAELGFIRNCGLGLPYWHPDNKKAAKIAKTACADGIYCIEDNR